MKLWQLICLLVFVAVLSAFAVYTLSTAGQQQVDYVFQINESVGFDLGTDMLRMGVVPPEGTSSREISLRSEAERMRIRVTGNGSPYISVSENPLLFTNNSANVTVYVHVPKNATAGTYTGTLYFVPVK